MSAPPLPPRADELGLCLCHVCGNVCTAPRRHKAGCPRCGSALHRRKPNVYAKTWAYLLAALILYIPANTLPVMFTGTLGRGTESTILEGVVEFWENGSWGVALVIFIASVAVPSIKFLVLGTLLVTCQRRSDWATAQRARLYRFVELIGYWSMLDVIVVALVSALVHFGALSSAAPRLGIVFFGFVVVLTMLAAMSFDPRLIWDAEVNDDGQA